MRGWTTCAPRSTSSPARCPSPTPTPTSGSGWTGRSRSVAPAPWSPARCRAGRVRVDDELELHSADHPPRRVTVRGLQSLGQPHDRIAGVARVAVNLRGVPREAVARGDVAAHPRRLAADGGAGRPAVRCPRGGARPRRAARAVDPARRLGGGGGPGPPAGRRRGPAAAAASAAAADRRPRGRCATRGGAGSRPACTCSTCARRRCAGGARPRPRGRTGGDGRACRTRRASWRAAGWCGRRADRDGGAAHRAAAGNDHRAGGRGLAARPGRGDLGSPLGSPRGRRARRPIRSIRACRWRPRGGRSACPTLGWSSRCCAQRPTGPRAALQVRDGRVVRGDAAPGPPAAVRAALGRRAGGPRSQPVRRPRGRPAGRARPGAAAARVARSAPGSCCASPTGSTCCPVPTSAALAVLHGLGDEFTAQPGPPGLGHHPPGRRPAARAAGPHGHTERGPDGGHRLR